MPRYQVPAVTRESLLAQLSNFKATRDGCHEPQRSLFASLIAQIERDLAQGNYAQNPTAEPLNTER